MKKTKMFVKLHRKMPRLESDLQTLQTVRVTHFLFTSSPLPLRLCVSVRACVERERGTRRTEFWISVKTLKLKTILPLQVFTFYLKIS